MGKEDRAFKPLMFIDQPTETNPPSSMQQTYSSAHNHTNTHVQKDIKSEKNKPIKKRRRRPNRFYMIDEYNDVEDAQEDVNIKEESDKIEDKTFAELTIEEKVFYCTTRPSYLPRIMCMIKTEKETVVGIIGKYEEGIVHIRPQRSRKIIELPVEAIKNIRMVGF